MKAAAHARGENVATPLVGDERVQGIRQHNKILQQKPTRGPIQSVSGQMFRPPRLPLLCMETHISSDWLLSCKHTHTKSIVFPKRTTGEDEEQAGRQAGRRTNGTVALFIGLADAPPLGENGHGKCECVRRYPEEEDSEREREMESEIFRCLRPSGVIFAKGE